MLRDARHIAEAYSAVPTKPVSVPGSTPLATPTATAPVNPGDTRTLSIANEEPKKEAPKQAVKDWIRLEPGLYPIDTIRKADHTAHTILQFIYSISAGPDAVSRILKTLNKAYKQDHK